MLNKILALLLLLCILTSVKEEAVKVSYDPEANAVYITLKGHGVARTECINSDIAIDYGPDGDIHGIEVLSACDYLAIDPENAEVELEHLKVKAV